jgi:signal transduction histidine kinase
MGRSTAANLRTRLLLTVLGALVVVLAGLTFAFNAVLAHRLGADATGVVQARATAEVAALHVSRGRILLPEAPDDTSPDTQVWVFQGGQILEQPRTGDINRGAAAALALRAPATQDVRSTDTRLYSLPVAESGRRVGAVVAGVSLAPYGQTRRTALVASIILAVVVLVAVGLGARWLIGRALRPVAEMTRQAEVWSERDLDRRFAVGPPNDELAQLAHVLNGLLDRLAASLRREQRLSAEISHELRTPLASLVAEAQYALRHGHQTEESRATLEHILHSARKLGGTLDVLMAAARAELNPRSATSDAVAGARAAAHATSAHAMRPGVDITVNAPQGPIRVAVESELVERILVPLLDNAARHARSSISITVGRASDAVTLTVDDDGPGIPLQEQERIFQPGHRATDAGAATAVASASVGLGLALCRRLARSAGGDVDAQTSDSGARFVVRLPAA